MLPKTFSWHRSIRAKAIYAESGSCCHYILESGPHFLSYEPHRRTYAGQTSLWIIRLIFLLASKGIEPPPSICSNIQYNCMIIEQYLVFFFFVSCVWLQILSKYCRVDYSQILYFYLLNYFPETYKNLIFLSLLKYGWN